MRKECRGAKAPCGTRTNVLKYARTGVWRAEVESFAECVVEQRKIAMPTPVETPHT